MRGGGCRVAGGIESGRRRDGSTIPVEIRSQPDSTATTALRASSRSTDHRRRRRPTDANGGRRRARVVFERLRRRPVGAVHQPARPTTSTPRSDDALRRIGEALDLDRCTVLPRCARRHAHRAHRLAAPGHPAAAGVGAAGERYPVGARDIRDGQAVVPVDCTRRASRIPSIAPAFVTSGPQSGVDRAAVGRRPDRRRRRVQHGARASALGCSTTVHRLERDRRDVRQRARAARDRASATDGARRKSSACAIELACRERLPAARGPGAPRHRHRSSGSSAADPAGARADPAGGRHRLDGAAARRDRHRQGAVRHADPRAERAARAQRWCASTARRSRRR